MEREEAVSVLKEIFNKCNLIEGKAINLMPPDANNVFSQGCQIHIESRNDTHLENCLKTIASSNSLAFAKEGQQVIIYKAS
jgi:hypothetical protein